MVALLDAAYRGQRDAAGRSKRRLALMKGGFGP
jgi:hypothetical protein